MPAVDDNIVAAHRITAAKKDDTGQHYFDDRSAKRAIKGSFSRNGFIRSTRPEARQCVTQI